MIGRLPSRVLHIVLVTIAAVALTACQTHRPDVDLRGAISECGFHQIALQPARVRLGIGCSLPQAGYLEARDRSFPHSFPRCMESRRDYCIVSVCESCIRAEREWETAASNANPLELRLTGNEREQIEVMIKKETNETILSIQRKSSGMVEVRTGVVRPGRLEGGGQTFLLKRHQKEWKIQKRGLWVS